MKIEEILLVAIEVHRSVAMPPAVAGRSGTVSRP